MGPDRRLPARCRRRPGRTPCRMRRSRGRWQTPWGRRCHLEGGGRRFGSNEIVGSRTEQTSWHAAPAGRRQPAEARAEVPGLRARKGPASVVGRPSALCAAWRSASSHVGSRVQAGGAACCTGHCAVAPHAVCPGVTPAQTGQDTRRTSNGGGDHAAEQHGTAKLEDGCNDCRLRGVGAGRGGRRAAPRARRLEESSAHHWRQRSEAARGRTWRSVRVLAPTEVPKALATSLAPVPQPKPKAAVGREGRREGAVGGAQQRAAAAAALLMPRR
jgi:hypothetical protein